MKTMRNAVIAMFVAATFIAGGGLLGDSVSDMTSAGSPPGGRYASVNGLKMYYEIHGTGSRPLVLLHGGLSTIEVDFGKVLPALSKTRRVIAIEQQAHGHTADTNRPLTHKQMAADTVELLRQLKIANADFFSYSMGGGIAVEIAMPRLIAKIRDLDVKWKGWPPQAIRSIKAPTLLIIGDADIVRPEHTVEMFRLFGGGVPGDIAGLPRSQLAVLPDTTHITLVHRADWLVSMTTEFLDAPMPKAK